MILAVAKEFIGALKFAQVATTKAPKYKGTDCVLIGPRKILSGDGHRLSFVDTTWEFSDSFLVHRDQVEFLLKTIKPREDLDIVEVEVKGGDMTVSLQGSEGVTVPIIHGTPHPAEPLYPSWVQDKDRAPPEYMALNAKYLADAAKACIFLANPNFLATEIYAGDTSIVFEPKFVAGGITTAYHLVSMMRT